MNHAPYAGGPPALMALLSVQLGARKPEEFERLEFAPAEEAQIVDNGEGAPILEPVTGRC